MCCRDQLLGTVEAKDLCLMIRDAHENIAQRVIGDEVASVPRETRVRIVQAVGTGRG